jgi:hypothetical protein
MPGICDLNVKTFRQRLAAVRQSYIDDWQRWLETVESREERAAEFGATLRRWQACRPNRMRRCRSEAEHRGPYLEDLIDRARPDLQTLDDFDIRQPGSFTPPAQRALRRLWEVFRGLSFGGRTSDALTGAVGISKAVLLLTEGRVGPAFDSSVRKNLGIAAPETAREWIFALQVVSYDIRTFEAANGCTIHEAAPKRLASLRGGRIYDLALGPGNQLGQ